MALVSMQVQQYNGQLNAALVAALVVTATDVLLYVHRAALSR
jgi:hypothetical protein